MAQKALETINARNNFYQSNLYWISGIVFVLVLLTIAHISLVLTYKSLDTQPVYFATLSDGALLEIHPFKEPSITDEALTVWATEAALKTYSVSFVNYLRDIQESRKFFTKTGFDKFRSAFKLSNNLESLKALQRTMYATVPDGASAKITKRGLLNGVYSWAVELPLTIIYAGGDNAAAHQKIKLTMLITRVSNLEVRAGVGIEDFIAEDVF